MAKNADGTVDLEKVADPFAADPQTQAEPAATETPAEQTPPEPTAEELSGANTYCVSQLSATTNTGLDVIVMGYEY